jgi:hypothetical protein
MTQKKIRKAPAGAKRSDQVPPPPLPYSLAYPEEWERLFKDTAEVLANGSSNDARTPFVRLAFERIVKASRPPPRALYGRDDWKRGPNDGW